MDQDPGAGGPNPLIAERQDTTTWATGLWLVEDIQQAAGGISSGAWVDASIGAAMVGLDALGLVVDPFGSLVSMGVGWLMEHIQPLSDALDWLAGDPDQITAYAQTWGNIATHTGDGGTDLTDAVQREAAPWTGVAAGAYRTHAGDQVTALQGIAEAAAAIGEAVQGAAQLVATVRTIVRDLIAECVAILVARIPQWLAMEGFTLGIATPVVVSQVTALVARWVSRITRFLDGLIRSIGNLIPLLRRLGDLIGELKELLARLARTDPTAPRMTDETPGTGPPREGGPDGGQQDPSDFRESIRDPSTFDPNSVRGMESDDLAATIPDNWTSEPSRSGGGTVYRDPDNPGRQIRIMPGYPAGNRPDPVTHGPYAVVSQNGVTVKVPLAGNPTLGSP